MNTSKFLMFLKIQCRHNILPSDSAKDVHHGADLPGTRDELYDKQILLNIAAHSEFISKSGKDRDRGERLERFHYETIAYRSAGSHLALLDSHG